MARSNQLINSNRSKVKDLSKIQILKINFFLNISLLILGRLTSTWGKEPPVITTRKELKKDTFKEEQKKINCSGLQKNLGILEKEKRTKAANP